MSVDRDEVWFATLYRDLHPSVLRYALRRVPPDEADDVVSEVFTTAWRRRNEVEQLGLVWLLATARHQVMHARRSAARQARLLTAVAAQSAISDEDCAERRGVDEQLQQALAVLSPADREILLLSAWEQLCPAEIAGVMGCSSGAVRVRLHRARRRLVAGLSPVPPVGARLAERRDLS